MFQTFVFITKLTDLLFKTLRLSESFITLIEDGLHFYAALKAHDSRTQGH
jgi:hypothetical protein